MINEKERIYFRVVKWDGTTGVIVDRQKFQYDVDRTNLAPECEGQVEVGGFGQWHCEGLRNHRRHSDRGGIESDLRSQRVLRCGSLLRGKRQLGATHWKPKLFDRYTRYGRCADPREKVNNRSPKNF